MPEQPDEKPLPALLAAEMLPRQLPEIRHRIRRDIIEKGWLRKLASNLDAPDAREYGNSLSDEQIMGLNDPETRADVSVRMTTAALDGMLIYVSRDMTSLVMEASKTLTGWPLRRSDIPSSSGVAVFDGILDPDVTEDPEECPMTQGIGWCVTPDDGVFFTLYSNRNYLIRMGVDLLTIGRLPAIVPNGGWFATQIDGKINWDAGDTEFWVRHYISGIVSAWRIMTQTRICESEYVTPDRASRRRAIKDGVIDLGKVRVITLRREQSEGPGASSREFHVRWVVRGHWRNQWYPSIQDHRPVWVTEHLKGPDGAPLLVGDKVHALVR